MEVFQPGVGTNMVILYLLTGINANFQLREYILGNKFREMQVINPRFRSC